MSEGLRRKVVLGALVTAMLGCGGGAKENFSVPSAGDDSGPPSRTVIDGGRSTGGATGSGTDGSSAATTFGDGGTSRMVVKIEGPLAAEIVAGKRRFTPAVAVTIEAAPGAASDTVSEVKSTVRSVRDRDAPGAEAIMNLTKIERMPEQRLSVFRYLESPVDLSMLESGEYELTVAALSSGGAKSQASVRFLVDAGPTIRIESPGNNRYYRSSARVEVTVADTQFGPVQDVSMTVGPRPLKFEAPTAPGGKYTASIVFKDYDPALEGDQLLTVRAANKNKTEAVAVVKFTADDKGPLIASSVPKIGDLIGKVITISTQITDPAGVLDSSVVAVIAHGDATYEVKLRPPATGSMAPPNTYQGLFDTTRLPINALFPSISFRASDVLGNESSIGYLVSLDNTPPIADLDPPNRVRMRKKDGTVYRCSQEFDPVGGRPSWPGYQSAVNDRDVVSQLFQVRARIEDRGNQPLSGSAPFTIIAGLDEARVQLLILDDTTKPLVVDTNGDGVCDAINPLITPTTKPMSATDALLVNMVPVPPGGVADFTPDLALPSDMEGGFCLRGKEPTSPDPLCPTTDLTISLGYTGMNSPAIWAVPPVQGDRVQCVGRPIDGLGNNISDGWVCLAVAVSDKLGNLQVSRPLRVCLDKDGKGGECSSGMPMPNCTGTVTAAGPPAIVDAGATCKPWAAFPATEIREIQ